MKARNNGCLKLYINKIQAMMEQKQILIKGLTFPNNTFHTVLCTKERIPNSRVSLLFPCSLRITIHQIKLLIIPTNIEAPL